MIRFSKPLTFPVFEITTVSVYRDDKFIGNLVLKDDMWHTSKPLTGEPIYFETLEDAKVYVERLGK